MKNQIIKRCVSVLISMCMCISLFPTFMVSAAEVVSNIKELTSEDLNLADADKKAKVDAALPDGGHVLKYSSSTDDNTTYVKIDVCAYNVQDVQTYLLKLKYDKSVVTPVIYNSDNKTYNGTALVADDEATSGTTLSAFFKSAPLSPVAKQSDTVTTNQYLLNSRWNQDTTVDALKTYTAPFQFAQGTGIGKTTDTNGVEYGTVSVEMTTREATEMTGLLKERIYNEGFIGEGEGKQSVNLTFAQDDIVDLYSLYFKVNEGKTVNKSTITIWSDDANKSVPKGAAFKRYDGTNDTAFVSENVVMVNFPGEDQTYEQPIKVQNPVGDAINGAEVKLYKADDNSLIGTYTSNDDGLLVDASTGRNSIALKAQTYKYVATRTDYLEATGDLQVLGDGKTLVITMRYASEATYDVTIKVKNADTGDNVANASVSLNGVSFAGWTDINGEITGKSSADATKAYPLIVTCDGYDTLNTSITLEPTVDYKNLKQSLFEVEIVPSRTGVQILTPKDKKTGNPITYSNVTITKLSTDLITNAWGGATNSANHSYTSEDVTAGYYEFKLPHGRQGANMAYKINATATGYEPSETYYMTIDKDENVTFYTDNTFTTSIDILQLELEPYSEPLYTVTIEKPQYDFDNKLDYVEVTVSLRNINAFYGTFGLKYDSTIMNLDATNDFAIDDGVKNQIEFFLPADESGNAATISDLKNPLVDNTQGYHIFTWKSKSDNAGESFKTLGDNKTIAHYKFWAKSADIVLEDVINKSTFSVIEYDKTANGTAAAAYYGSKTAAKPFLDCYWRAADDQNDPANYSDGNLPDGRLDKSMALNGGFYQAYAEEVAVDGIPTTVTGNKLYDVKTERIYNFPTKSIARLQFNVTNENDAYVDGATIQLYSPDKFTVDGSGKASLNSGAVPTATLTSDSYGSAYKILDAVSETTYAYRITKTGYWNYPSETNAALGDLETIKVLNDRTDTADVVLKSRTYHPVKLKLTGDSVPDVSTVAVNLGSDRAFNEHDYVFNIQAKPGYTFVNEQDLVFTIGDFTGTAHYNYEKNAYVISGTDITGLSTATEPDSYGFKAEDLVISIPYGSIIKPAPEEEQYTAVGTAGSHGTVFYNATGGSGTAETSADGNTVTINGIHSGESTGTFTFTAGDNYLIDKVYINGTATTAYQGKESMEYQFTEINRDVNITVTFGQDGGGGTVVPSTDTLLTVVVADRGSVSLSAPEALNGKTIKKNSSKTFILQNVGASGQTVSFSPTPENSYIRDKIYANGTYITSPYFTAQQGINNVLMVSFKKIDSDPFNVFVTAHVISGSGSITPSGITGYSVGTSPVYEMTPTSGLIMGSYSVDGTEKEINKAGTYTYKMEPLTADTDLGVKFAEVGYKVTGRIDLKQGITAENETNQARLGMGNPLSGAIVRFVRDDGYEAPFITTGYEGRVVEFEKELPKGNWTITVSKPGYVNFVITDFEVKEVTGNAANELCPGTAAITPYIGDASHDGKYITLEDIGLVANGFMTGSSTPSKTRADVNDDGILDVDNDMYFAKRNYAVKETRMTYTEFVEKYNK